LKKCGFQHFFHIPEILKLQKKNLDRSNISLENKKNTNSPKISEMKKILCKSLKRPNFCFEATRRNILRTLKILKWAENTISINQNKIYSILNKKLKKTEFLLRSYPNEFVKMVKKSIDSTEKTSLYRLKRRFFFVKISFSPIKSPYSFRKSIIFFFWNHEINTLESKKRNSRNHVFLSTFH
jgi:hypothetical protein